MEDPAIDLSQAPLEDVYKRLQCNENGLSTEEAACRLQQFGSHSERPQKGHEHLIMQFLGHLWNPVCWMLEASAIGLLVLSSGSHRPPDWPAFLGIIFVLCMNSALGVFAERRAFRGVDSLRQSAECTTNIATMANVKRDGVWSEIEVSRLVPGDIIALQTGDTIPVNCRLTSARLYISYPEDNKRLAVGDSCFVGWIIGSGYSEAIVIASGKSLQSHPTRVQSNGGLHEIVAQIGVFCLAIIVLLVVAELLVLYTGFHYSYHRGVNAIFVLLIGGIPIALPTVVGVSLSMGVDELASRGILTTRVAAMEELARVTVLCAEQTAAITEEKYAASDVKAYDPFTESEVRLMAAYAQSTAPSPNPQNPASAVEEWRNEYYGGRPQGHPDIEIAHWKPLCRVDGPIQATYRIKGSTQLRRVAKGLVGHIAEMWTQNHTNALEIQLEEDIEDLARQGVSAIALAYEDVEGDDPEAHGNGFQLVGIVGFRLPLRGGTEQAVADALAMGVQMKMVTSNQLAMAKATGRRAGLGDVMFPAKVFRDEEYLGRPLDALILEATGFGGVFPMDKQKLLQRLRHMGHFCAMISKEVELASAANVSITVNSLGGDFVTTQPCLPAVVDAVHISRQISWRLHGSLIYVSAICIRIVLCFSLLQFIYKIDFPPFMILLVALATDITILTLCVDRAVPGTKPGRWDFTEIISYSTAYGVYLALSTVLFVFTTKTHFFQRKFSLALSPAQPQHDNQLHMLIYLQVAQISHALIFVVHSQRLFFLHRPSTVLLGAFCLAQMGSSIIAAYGNWEFAGVHSVDAGWIGVVWVWNIIWFIPLDLIKLGVGLALRTRNADFLE
ncbi:Plasma membrane ATPase [Mycena venus]|uniref:Plasma membrane ATPase n=1 Tax=Mycena venus TaxID=2733690 RepID=A0A8H6XA82_9AGAR|nr:Plasma membrane ATPase [Mycena venus]